MPDVLIRDVPDEVLAAIDRSAERLGLSRSEHLRRVMRQEATRGGRRVTVEDLQRLETLFADLDDPEVMRQAWS